VNLISGITCKKKVNGNKQVKKNNGINNYAVTGRISGTTVKYHQQWYMWCRLGGVVVSVLTTGPKGCGFKPGQGDGFLMAIKICS
jgi:hypothetical protein